MTKEHSKTSDPAVRSTDLLGVWSCGGGRQSCAIAVLIIQGRLPKPDFAVMSDTGRERYTTFPYVHKYLVPELESVGVKLEIVKASSGDTTARDMLMGAAT